MPLPLVHSPQLVTPEIVLADGRQAILGGGFLLATFGQGIVPLGDFTEFGLGLLAGLGELQCRRDFHPARLSAAPILHDETLVAGASDLKSEAGQIVIPVDCSVGIGFGLGAGNECWCESGAHNNLQQ
jgi:hypothetical protein